MNPCKNTGWIDRSLPTFKAMGKTLFPKRKPPTRAQVWFGRVVQLVFLGLILAFIGWRWQLKREVDELFASYRAAGLPTNGEELNAFYPTVPDDENAALHIMQAAKLLQEYPDERAGEISRFKVQRGNDPLSREQKELLLGSLGMNSNALALAAAAIMLPRCRYPTDLSVGLDANLSHLATVKQLGRLTEYQCLMALERNDSAEARDSICRLIGLAETLNNEPMIISCLVRGAMLNMAVRAIERTLNTVQLEEPTLTRLATSLGAVSDTNVLSRALAGEVASTANFLSLKQPELLMREMIDGDDEMTPAKARIAIGGLRISGLFARSLRFFLIGMQTNLALAQLPPPGCLRMTNQFEEMELEGVGHYYLLVPMVLPAYSKVVLKVVDTTARITLTKAAIAVELFRQTENHIPQQLHELVPEYLDSVPIDPFDGQPLRYRKLDRGYVVYSVGKDGQDDGGNEPPLRIKSTDTNSYDLTFIVER